MVQRINKSHQVNYIKKIHASTRQLGKHVSHTLSKIKTLIHQRFAVKGHEIFHLGGTKMGSLDFHNTGKSMASRYFYERIPVKTPDGEIFLYGETLKPYVKKWMKESKSGAFKGTFQDFMAQHPNLSSLSTENVRYLSQAERDQTEVSVVAGYLCQVGLDSTSTQKHILPDGNYAFVLAQTHDKEGNLQVKFYAALKGKSSKGKIQHSSFARGGNVVSAGILEISSGKIVNISNFSGHYRPTTKELIECLLFLKEQKYDIQQCYVKHYTNSLLMGLAHIIPVKGFAAVLTRADKWLDKHLSNKKT